MGPPLINGGIAEADMLHRRNRHTRVASMGPPLINGGIYLVLTSWNRSYGFNGAAVDQRRNLNLCLRQAHSNEVGIRASMGPPLINGGIAAADRRLGHPFRASMGPPLINGGIARPSAFNASRYSLLQWGRR
jgi:hypothetical protein